MTGKPKVLLDIASCAEFFGTSHRTVQWWRIARRFPSPADSESRQRMWSKAKVVAWAVRERMTDRIPITYWPDAAQPAAYLGGQDLNGALAQTWRTELGDVVVVWPQPDTGGIPYDELVSRLPGAAAVLHIDHDFEVGGPNVTGLVPALPGRSYDAGWVRLSQVIGMPVPYWPLRMRTSELVLTWRPGAAQAVAAAVPPLDTASLLRLAATYEDGHPAARVLVNLARISEHDAAESALYDNETVDRLCQDKSTMVIAARPMPFPAARRDDLEPLVRRAGWLDVLSRSDTLAARCVLQGSMQDGGVDLPFTPQISTIKLATPTGDEWAQRLVEAPTRTAAFELFSDRDDSGELLLDPETDAPVIRKSHSGGGVELRTISTQRLAATAPLAEIVLEDPIWVRTEDGTLYLAPQGAHAGISWGHPGGSGTATLALLIDRLLDDITAVAPDEITGAPETLWQLTQLRFPAGTVLTRDQLEAAREGRWRPWEKADPDLI